MTRVVARKSAISENMYGALWCSGAVARNTPSGSIRRPSARADTCSVHGACPDTITFGRPVLPPEVGAFQDGPTTFGKRLGAASGASSKTRRREPRPAGRLQPDDERGSATSARRRARSRAGGPRAAAGPHRASRRPPSRRRGRRRCRARSTPGRRVPPTARRSPGEPVGPGVELGARPDVVAVGHRRCVRRVGGEGP